MTNLVGDDEHEWGGGGGRNAENLMTSYYVTCE